MAANKKYKRRNSSTKRTKNNAGGRKYSAGRITILGMMVAVAMIFSYIETFIPINLAIPGIKLGLANIVTMIVLVEMGFKDAVIVSLIRVCLSSLLFGNISVMIYSLAGAAFSIIIMKLIETTKIFGVTGISICGGVAHNMGQLILAAVIMENQTIMGYAPVLLISGTVAGIIIGLIASIISRSVMLPK